MAAALAALKACQADADKSDEDDGEGGARAGSRGDGDAAAERGDGILDHIHADPAAREVRHLRGGGKAGQEQEVVDLLLRELCL